nr:uncharacterized protein LOC112038979 [Quercus suber]
MNHAFVAKLTWDVASNAQKPWVQMFQKKYVRGKNFMKMPTPKSISWSSQSIFGCRDVVKKGLCHKIGSGWNTWILEDPWVPEESDFTPKVKSGVVLTEHLVANLIDQEVDNGIGLSHRVSQDQIFWCLSPSGEYTVKSAYNILRSIVQVPHQQLNSKGWKDIWKLNANARLKHLLWKIAWEVLSTCVAINNRFSIPSIDCCLCKNAPETLDHIFLQCDWASQIWLLAPWPLNLQNIGNISICVWIKIILYPKGLLGLDDCDVKYFQLYALIVLDQIWVTRNKIRFEGKSSNPLELSRQILRSYEEHKQAWKDKLHSPIRKVEWKPPPYGWVKLNFDVAVREEKISLAIVGRDDKGVLVFAWTEQIEPSSPLVGKAKAALCAIKRAIENGFSKIIVEGDAWNVIDPLSSAGKTPHWSIMEVITDILDLVKCFEAIVFSFVYREGNVPAHLLAQWAAFVNWVGPVPISKVPLLVTRAVERDGFRRS